MSVQRFKSLLFKSTRIQQLIENELKRPRLRTLRLLKLQQLRLKLRDSMTRMAARDTGFMLEPMRVPSRALPPSSNRY